MILVDSSAWIEFLRGRESTVGRSVRQLVLDEQPIMSCDVIRMELLAGARSATDVRDLRRLLDRTTVFEIRPQHYDDAAQLYRQSRANGETVRKMMDCLIAACAIAADVPVLHDDADFVVLARHSALRA